MGAEDAFVIKASDVRFRRDPSGHVVFHQAGQEQRIGGLLSAFPLTNAGRVVSVRDEAGQELGLLDDAHALDAESRRIVAQELERSYFMPRITDVLDVREELNVVTWEVQTDRGPRTFEVRHILQNVRRLGRRRVVIKDVDGNRYEIRDWTALPAPARELIQLFL